MTIKQFGPTIQRPASNKFYIFDLDGTLAISRSGKLFSMTAEDTLILPPVAAKIADLKAAGYNILIVTNQSYFTADTIAKLQLVTDTLDVPLLCAAGNKSAARKPAPDMWYYYCMAAGIDPLTVSELHMVGDAAGPTSIYPPYRWAATDRLFADAIGATFYEPLDVFPAYRLPTIPDYLTVTVMVGNQGSGKTNFARQLAEMTGHQHIEGDKFKTRGKTLNAAKVALAAGKSVIIDATNGSAARRRECYDLADAVGAVKRVFWIPRDGRPFNALRTEGKVPPVAHAVYTKRFDDPRGDGVPLELVY
jgi:DNA 3'-phosphatase